MRTLILAILLLGCPPRLNNPDVSDDDSSDDDDSTSSALSVSDAAAGCGLLPQPNPMPVGNVLAYAGQNGSLSVSHFAFSEGCCPQITVDAALTDRRIEVDIDLFDDFCQCICTLDVVYTIQGVPSGEWALVVNGQELIDVDVP